MATPTSKQSEEASGHAIAADLIAVLVAVTAGQPRVMTIQNGSTLPSGPFAQNDRSLQSGLRTWVEQQTGHPLGYVEQLYTFADRDRATTGIRVISISYLALTRESRDRNGESGWRDWYSYFPWEDHRSGPQPCFKDIVARLLDWTRTATTPAQRRVRSRRVAVSFGLDGRPWNEELILQRYELLYEAALVAEAPHVRRRGSNARPVPGQSMSFDHRRILATAIARLRAKIKYRPVVFELMPPGFTLLQLQRTVEALAGKLVHKQNFRRLIEQQDLVEETGAMAADTGGRPAKLFRFRRGVVDERAVVGTKLPLTRA
jgi:hypothetical protein